MPSSLQNQLLSLVWPVLLQGLLSTIIIFTDRLILGGYSDEALASMQASGPLLWSITSLFGAYSVGVLALIGRSVGEQNRLRSARVMSSALVLAMAIGVCLALVGYLTTSNIVTVVIDRDLSPEAALLAETYIKPVILSCPLFLLGTLCTVAFQASGDTKTPMWLTGIGGFLNLALSWALVFGALGCPELGILGAAVGTVTAAAVQGLGGLALIYRNPFLSFVRPSARELKAILSVSWSAFGERLFFHTAYLIFAGYVGRLGNEAMTAHQALMAIESLGYILASAFGVAAGALVAQKLGAQQSDEAEQTGILAAKMGAGLLCFIGFLFFMLAKPLLSLFSTDPNVLRIGIQCMTIAAFAQPLMALTDVFAGSLRGAGDTKNPMKIALIGPFLVRLTSCWFLAFELNLGLVGIWLGSSLDWLVRAIWLGWIFSRGAWKSIKL